MEKNLSFQDPRKILNNKEKGWRDTQQNGIQHNDTKPNDIQHNNTKTNDIQYKNTKPNDIQHNEN
jgi:hypothetical protein